jgi:hypothetical protein
VRFAVLQIGVIALASTVGIALRQLPDFALQNAQADFDKAGELLTELKSRTIDALGDAKSGFVDVGGEQYVVCTRSVNRNGVVSLTIKKGKNV